MSNTSILGKLMNEAEDYSRMFVKRIDLPAGLIYVATPFGKPKRFKLDMSCGPHAFEHIRVGVGIKRKDTLAIVVASQIVMVLTPGYQGADSEEDLLSHPDCVNLLFILGEDREGNREARFFKVIGEESVHGDRAIIPMEATDYPQVVLEDAYPLYPSPAQQHEIDEMLEREREESDPRNR